MSALLELKKANGGFAYVFSNAKGKPINPRNLNRAHDCILERAGIPHIGIHALRHTFASQLFANKVDIKVISKLLGHSDVSVTLHTVVCPAAIVGSPRGGGAAFVGKQHQSGGQSRNRLRLACGSLTAPQC